MIDYEEEGHYKEMSWKQVKQHKSADEQHDQIPRFTRSRLKKTVNQATINKQHELPTIPHHLVNAVYDEETEKMMGLKELVNHKNPVIRAAWLKALGNEYGKLMKGVGKKQTGKSRVGPGHNTIRFIHKRQVPKGKVVSYARFYYNKQSQ